MYIAREKSLADAKYYQTMKEAKANKWKLTPQLMELTFIEAISNNTKMFFGNLIEGETKRSRHQPQSKSYIVKINYATNLFAWSYTHQVLLFLSWFFIIHCI
ncbi:hypothetical protein Hanom_Chr12g01155971 [Helianthus anomalus]